MAVKYKVLHLPAVRRRSPVCSWRKEDIFATPLIPRGQRKLIFPQVHPQQLTLASNQHSPVNASVQTILGLILLLLQLTPVPSIWISTWWFLPSRKGGGVFPASLTHPLPPPPSHDLPSSHHFKGHCDQSWSFFQNGQESVVCVCLVNHLFEGNKGPHPSSPQRLSYLYFPCFPHPP